MSRVQSAHVNTGQGAIVSVRVRGAGTFYPISYLSTDGAGHMNEELMH
jgi:hypothetical protein